MTTARLRWGIVLVVCLLAAAPFSVAQQARQTPSRFDALAAPGPGMVVSPATTSADAVSVPASLRSGWTSFRAAHGDAWDVYLDARSGAPMLVQGQGLPLVPGSGNTLQDATPPTLESVVQSLREFMQKNRALLAADDAELTLNEDGSGALEPELWKVVFDRSVAGIPVEGDRYIFYIGHGNLISFGAARWAPIKTDPTPSIPSAEAQFVLYNYMGLTDADAVTLYDRGRLLFVPTAPEGAAPDSFAGPVGSGYSAALVWRMVLGVDGDPGRWVGLVDAHTGQMLALYDEIKYAQTKGGVFPLSNDASCPTGCEQTNFPMPYADIKIGSTNSMTSNMGVFTCSPSGSTATTTLSGSYIRVADACGAVSEAVACNADIDLGTSSGTDCTVPTGKSAGDTHAARTAYFHLNREAEHARWWLPANGWVRAKVNANVNVSGTCNAYWDGGAVNFYKSGGGCRNTGEISAVLMHEWGHGLDDNDGGGTDNPGEAYADITALMITHTSCFGRGITNGNCSGYGDSCTNCTGFRELDWDKHSSHSPATPESFVIPYCYTDTGGYNGPCNREEHCEGVMIGQTMWDLAVRDLPAMGLDSQTAWQVADRLWFKSRAGSGGNAYGCSAPASNRSCAVGSWFNEMRNIDDDDGNLANGTPHAGAIFAAFNRHNLPCGASTDATNQSTTTCATLAAPVMTTPAGSAYTIALSWSAVAGASSYNVLRNEIGCSWGYNVIANVTGTTYTDTNLPNRFPLYYAIQAVGSNAACTGTLSACNTAQATGPHAIYASTARVADACVSGGAGNSNGVYEAGERIQFSVSIKNDGDRTLTGVTATLTPTTPGVSMIQATASYSNIAVSATGTSLSPHFTAQLPPDLACGAVVNYTLTIYAAEGSWTDYFSQTIGQSSTINGTAVSENFSSGIPAAWTVVDGGLNIPTGPAQTWTTANPCSRTFTAPIANPVAMVDSNCAGVNSTQDEQLITPTLDLSGATSVTLAYDEYFNWYSGGLSEKGDVDVKSSRTSGAWSNVIRNQNASTANPNHRSVDITNQAAGAANTQIRFRYYNGKYENYWQVDNVQVTWSGPGPCVNNVCYGYQTADLAVGVVDSPDPTPTGQNITYTLTAVNNGPDTAYTVQVSDTTPVHTTFQSATAPAGWTCTTPAVGGTGAVNCTASSFPTGSPAVFTIVVRVGWCVGATVITDTATIATMSTDPTPANNSSTTTTTVTDSGACDDGNPCTVGDVCLSGVCTGGAPGGVPAEVDNSMHVTLSSTTDAQISWTVPALATRVDVLRGLVSALPVGPGGADESCFGNDLTGTSVSDSETPAVGTAFWYLVRGENSCGNGPYGLQYNVIPPVQRTSTTCQ